MHHLLADAAGGLMAKGAVDMAIWDLYGKANKMRLVDMLGGPVRDEIRLWWPLSASQSPEDDRVRVEELVNTRGIRSFMFKTGGEGGGPDETVLRVAAFDEYAAEMGVKLCVDANQGWSLEQAKAFALSVQPYRSCLAFLEQPLPKESPRDDWIELRRHLAGIPISADESVVTLQDAISASEWAGVISLKVSKMGGITRTTAIVRAVDALGAPHSRPKLQVNSMLESGITQAAMLAVAASSRELFECTDAPGVWGHSFMSCLRLADDITDFSGLVHAEKGWVSLPTGAGLGVEVSLSKLKQYTVSESIQQYTAHA
eukprot:TRINITY_DN2853_c0_g1_i1.p1 TRINITY_DN2853_c0_g1~~TRINITY_DN2853_c0_g1_i1.p1  ORF type:complete len:315 (+),score=60.31 TRINITY_DN2853_c0_g1_i1:397-1341(+)